MAIIIDPDLLAQGTEVTITTATKLIDLNIAGDLTTDGVTMKCLYSFLKEEWKNDSALIKFPFPMVPITDEQFEFANGWDLADNASRDLIRNSGWAVKNVAGATTAMYAGVITLGSIEANDQVYFTQVDSSTATTTNFTLTGPVNQAVQILSDPNGDGSFVDGFDNRGFLKLWLREWGQTYDTSTLTDIGVAQMSYQAYRFPLTTGADIKISDTEGDVGTLAPFTNMGITLIPGTGFTVHADATVYPAGAVVQDINGRWYRTVAGGTSGTDNDLSDGSDGGILDWVAYAGERQVGTSYYAYDTIIDGDVAGNQTNPSAEDIYQFVQWSLRQATDIDDGAGTSNGKVTDEMLGFVGDTLVTRPGVFIDDYSPSDINRINFTDFGGNVRTFPFTASLTLSFGANLVADPDAIYRVFFTNDDPPGANLGNDYGTANATLVDDAAGVDMAGPVSGQSSITLTYAYDTNNQRGGASAGTNAPITAVAIGLSSGQFVSATGTIERSNANNVALVAALERNYDNP